MNRKDWAHNRKSLIGKGTVDLLRKRISEEDLRRIQYQTYGEYVEGLGVVGRARFGVQR